ncbi:glycosyltransferase family 2 protein [Bradyrhizobium sp. TZ2]
MTIAIPTFNRAALLKDCVQSALSQTYTNIEVLVSDNASTDDTTKVLREFSDNRLRILRQKKTSAFFRIGTHAWRQPKVNT